MKKTKFLLLSLIIFFMVPVVHGQTKTEIFEDKKPYIEVLGTAEKEVIPDEIFIKIILLEKFVGKEKQTIEMQEEKLKAALKEIGVELSNLSLTDVNADNIRVSWTKNDVISKKDFTLKVSNATTVGQVFQQLDKLEINGAYISMVNHSKLDSLKKETRVLAITAAKDKADYLLNAIGEKTGKPLVIHEKDYHSMIPASELNIRGARADGDSYYIDGIRVRGQIKEEDEVQFQKIKIQSAIYVKFLIQ